MLPHCTLGKIKAWSGLVEKFPKGITENSPQIYRSHQEKWFSDPPIRKNVYNTLFRGLNTNLELSYVEKINYWESGERLLWS